MSHSIYSPSSSKIWGNCPAAAYIKARSVNKENERTILGTAAHWVAEQVLQSGGAALDWLGKLSPKGVTIDQEICEGAQIYIDHNLDILKSNPDAWMMIEKRVFMPDIHPDCFGTLDCGIVTPNVLYIPDYKHGFVEVDPVGNTQLALYAKGILNELPDYRPDWIVFSIVQPFSYHSSGPIREWACALSDLWPIWDKLYKSANGPKDAKHAGEHCRHCPARWDCETTRKYNYSFMDCFGQSQPDAEISTPHLALEYELLKEYAKVLKNRIEATEDELHHRIQNGDDSSHLTLESKPGRLNWLHGAQATITALSMIGVDARKEDCKTPRQVAMEIVSGERDQFYKTIKPLTKRETSLKLINRSDSILSRAFKKGE